MGCRSVVPVCFIFLPKSMFLPADSSAFVGHGERESRRSCGVARLVATSAIGLGRKMRGAGKWEPGRLGFLCSCQLFWRGLLDRRASCGRTTVATLTAGSICSFLRKCVAYLINRVTVVQLPLCNSVMPWLQRALFFLFMPHHSRDTRYGSKL